MRARDALGCTPLKLARAYASIPPNKAETEGVGVRRWDAAAGGAGADWATCLHLLEHAAAAADVARDGAVLMAASSTRVGGLSLHSGRQTERDKKINKKRICLIWPPTGNSNTRTNQKHTHAMQEINVRRFDR